MVDLSIVFCMFTRDYQRVTLGVFPMSSGKTCHVESRGPRFWAHSLNGNDPCGRDPCGRWRSPVRWSCPGGWAACTGYGWSISMGKKQSKMDDSWWFKWGARHFGKPPTSWRFLWAIGKSYEPQNKEMGYVFLNGSGAESDGFGPPQNGDLTLW